jgi:hypothetical protein
MSLHQLTHKETHVLRKSHGVSSAVGKDQRGKEAEVHSVRTDRVNDVT